MAVWCITMKGRGHLSMSVKRVIDSLPEGVIDISTPVSDSLRLVEVYHFLLLSALVR